MPTGSDTDLQRLMDLANEGDGKALHELIGLANKGDANALHGLIDLTNKGNTTAREALFVYVSDGLLAKIRRKLGPRKGSKDQKDRLRREADSYDVFQEGMLRFIQAIDNVKPKSVEHFFNLAAMHIGYALLDLGKKLFGPHGFGRNRRSDGKPPDDKGGQLYERQGKEQNLDTLIDLNAEVEKLPVEQQVVVRLFCLGLTQDEAAEQLGISLSTFKRRLGEVGKYLQKVLGRDEQ